MCWVQGWLTGIFALFGYFNEEIVCLTKGTFKGTVEADSWDNISHYPISLLGHTFWCFT